MDYLLIFLGTHIVSKNKKISENNKTNKMGVTYVSKTNQVLESKKQS